MSTRFVEVVIYQRTYYQEVAGEAFTQGKVASMVSAECDGDRYSFPADRLDSYSPHIADRITVNGKMVRTWTLHYNPPEMPTLTLFAPGESRIESTVYQA